MSKKQYGFYIDSQRCTGCKTCELACKDYKDLTPDVSFRRIYEYCGGGWKQEGEAWTQDVFSYYLSISCNHCDNPACASVCPSGAMHKREDGFVVVNQDVCIGCQYCSMACPYGAPQFNQRTGRMTKCDGCFERVEQGLKPMCVESCPLRALDLLPIDELREKYGEIKDVAPLPPSHYTNPNMALRLNTNAKPTDFEGGFLANPKEVKMGAGLHELPLVFFTVFAQAVVGCFITLSLVLAKPDGQAVKNRLHYAMTILWGLMALGFIASTTHLGSPERAFNVLNRVGSSDLSNEIFTGSTFFALGGAYWALATAVFLQKDSVKLPLVSQLASLIAPISIKLPKGWATLGRIIVAISGVVFIGAMAKLYLIPTVPTWNTIFTPLAFGLTALLAGSALTVVLLQLAKVETGQALFAKLAALFAVIALVVTFFHYQHLAQTKNAIFQALDLVPGYMTYSIIRFGLIAVGVVAVFISLKKQGVWLSGLGFALIVAGELIARTLFYGTHMTVGLKALGG